MLIKKSQLNEESSIKVTNNKIFNSLNEGRNPRFTSCSTGANKWFEMRKQHFLCTKR